MKDPRQSDALKSKPQAADGDRPAGKRQGASEKKRQAILAAALEVFAAEGFAAARLDDVAARAGVAKGTIYLFFDDKEHLFEQLLVNAITPVLAEVEAVISASDMPLDDVLAMIFHHFRREVLETERREVVRLVLSEGRRFPRIAEAYHREVISKGLAMIRRLAAKAHARGELSSDAIERFPHLVVAPLLLALLWDGLFSRFDTLDVEGLMATHRATLLAGQVTAKPRKG